MIDTTWTCRAGADKVNENRGASEETSVRGHAARKHQKKLGDLEFGPWLGQASMLVVDDEPGMRGHLVRTLGPLCKRIEKTFDTEGAPRKHDAGLHHTFARRAGAERTSEFRVSLVVAMSAACRAR